MSVFPDSSPDRTMPMSVSNIGFMLDRLGQDCAPLQFLRELTKNSIEAILAREGSSGEIVWDVDWDHYAATNVFKLCVLDDGVGMTGEEMVRYINQLSSSVHEQSHEGNFGVGAKIAAATRNHDGLIYLSWKNEEGAMIHLWRDPDISEYGLRQFEKRDGTFGHWVRVADIVKPELIEGCGTKVVLLGNSPDEPTMAAPEGTPSPSRWISRYLNTRFFRFPEAVTVRAREGWENPRTDADRNLLRKVVGQEAYLAMHAEASGSVGLSGGILHWWILKDESALSQNSGFIASSGHVAALYDDELYEMTTGRAGVARLQQFGVIFGYSQVVLYVEPKSNASNRVTSNTARTHLLVDNEPLPWADWAAEFRDRLPSEIKDLMDRVVSGSVSSDHRGAIRERLRQIRELFRLSRYRLTPRGDVNVDPDIRAGGAGTESVETGNGRGRKRTGGRAGNIYAMFLDEDGMPAESVNADPQPEVKWLTVEEGTREPGFLEDRAAKFLPEQNLLQINGDFRVFTDMVKRWCQFYSEVPGAADTVRDQVGEWFEQALVECILGLQALAGSREWSVEDMAHAWSEEALTAAVMPRYHIDVNVKRNLGSKLGSLQARTAS